MRKRIILPILLALALSTMPVQAAEATEEDVDLLARIIYHEAGNQDETGKRLVGSVILNRVDDPRFPDTISGVLFQKRQFTTSSELFKVDPPEECYDAARAELEERTNTEVLFFNNGPVYGTYLFRHQDHNFGK